MTSSWPWSWSSALQKWCGQPSTLTIRKLGQVAHVSPSPWVTSREADITLRAPDVGCWRRLVCWSNNSANSHPSPGASSRRVLRPFLVPQCSYLPYRPRHQGRLANCLLDARILHNRTTSPILPCIHPAARTPSPLSAHPSIECRCTGLKARQPFVPGAQ